jgi:hypothetical protein
VTKGNAPIPATSGRLGLVQTGGRRIGRQIKLPWSKALEISFKSVKVRFWRSLITAGGIILAIAFLMATLTRSAVVEALKSAVPGELRALRVSLGPELLKSLQERAEAALGAARKADADELKAAPVEPKAEQVPGSEAAAAPAEPPKKKGKGGGKKAPKLLTRAAFMEKVRDAVKSSDFVPADTFLKKALEEKDDLAALPEIQELQKALAPVLAKLTRLTAVDDIRLTLIRQGEPPPEQRDAAAAGPSGESHSRDLWLMVLALLVAFVGITNAVLMSVTERFREIGTMKCLGALDSFVVKLFLIESAMQGLLGTLVGVALGGVLALAKVGLDYGSPAFGFMPWGQMLNATGLSIACGTVLAVAGALYPAYVAAKMEPAVAMRVDQ